MTCQLCSKELADDEVYVCDQCANECPLAIGISLS